MIGVVFSRINKFLLAWEFKGCTLALCNFSNLDIKKSKFSDCLIWDTDFVDVDLSGSDFSNCDLQGSKFQNADLSHTDFSGARNYRINPLSNKISKAKFSADEVISLLGAFDITIV
ncbi:MAG: pentapeptide repeat-containing protein [Leadbetterella sp.]|nr:pentapeptide repeat-containing protein [Leadbetterella sp.]